MKRNRKQFFFSQKQTNLGINVDSEFRAWGPATCEFHTFEAYQLMHSGSRKPKARGYRLCSRGEVDPRPRAATAQPASWVPSLQALDPLICRQGCFSEGRGAASRKGLWGALCDLGTTFPKREQTFLKILAAIFSPTAFQDNAFFLLSFPFFLIFNFPKSSPLSEISAQFLASHKVTASWSYLGLVPPPPPHVPCPHALMVTGLCRISGRGEER